MLKTINKPEEKMLSPTLEYHMPGSVDDAIALLSQYGDEALDRIEERCEVNNTYTPATAARFYRLT